MKYIMKCGCILDPDRVETETTQTRIVICPDHGARIKHRETECIDCGMVLIKTGAGSLPQRCGLCKSIPKAERVSVAELSEDISPNPGCPLYATVCGYCIKPMFPCVVGGV